MTVVKIFKKLYSANDHSKYKLSQDMTVRKWQTKIHSFGNFFHADFSQERINDT